MLLIRSTAKLAKTSNSFRNLYLGSSFINRFGFKRTFGEQNAPPREIKGTFGDLCMNLDKISLTTSRNEKTRLLTQALTLASSSETELSNAIKLCYCKIRISTTNAKESMQIASKLLGDVIQKVFNLSAAEYEEGSKKYSDFGDFASYLAGVKLNKDKSKSSTITCEDVVKKLDLLYDIKGKDSNAMKVQELSKLFDDLSTPEEFKYLIRIIQGNLRIGMGPKTIANSIQAIDTKLDKTKRDEMIKNIEKQVIGKQVTGTNLQIGISISPMLCKPSGNLPEIRKSLSVLGNSVICENKYDGERTQIHYSKGEIKMFSRNSEPQIENYKELSTKLLEFFKALKIHSIKDCIIDGEIIAVGENNEILPFQEVRKKDKDSKKSLKVIAFDLLWLNDNIIPKPLPERKKLLASLFTNPEAFIAPIEFTELNLGDADFESKITACYQKAMKSKCEGVVIKNASPASSPYDISGSRKQWVKVILINKFISLKKV